MNDAYGLPQPIPYQGSKRQLAPAILRYFPTNIARLVEPFAGSAAISIAAAACGLAECFWINDAHAPLIDLWREITSRPNELSAAYARLWKEQADHEREFFDQVRSRFNKTPSPDLFLYLLARCVKAAVRYNSNGEFNNTPDNRRKGARPSEMQRRILSTSRLLKSATRLTSWNYKKVLSDCMPDDLVYMDPPYQGVCGQRDQRYLPRFEHDEFCDELDKLNARGILFVVSYDGRTGSKTFGEPLPVSLGLKHLEIRAGRSTQATLLGRSEVTYESLYLSPALVEALPRRARRIERQLAFWQES
ncbi:MAG: DNA adenine methylase [Deltaproteobacteria bacterium]|nr:DNA adenine methylase [Deltaproteobacteria bacterium]